MLIAAEVDDLPDETAISAATLAELHFSVHIASDDETRKARIRRLTEVESTFDPLPIDEAVARAYGALAHTMVSSGRQSRVRVMDIFIAATAHVHALPLCTRNARDFRPFEGTIEIRIV